MNSTIRTPAVVAVPGRQARKTAILVAFGARYGLFIAEAHGDKQDFCAAAAKLKAEPDGTPVFLE